MKVKEIISILQANDKEVSLDEIVGLLDNIGIEDANEETDIEKIYVAKLSKRYGVDIKPIKAKKEPAKKPDDKVVKIEVKPEVKKEEVKAEVKKEEPKKETKASEKKAEVKDENSDNEE